MSEDAQSAPKRARKKKKVSKPKVKKSTPEVQNTSEQVEELQGVAQEKVAIVTEEYKEAVTPAASVPSSVNAMAQQQEAVLVATAAVKKQVEALFRGKSATRIVHACAMAKIKVLQNIQNELSYEVFLNKIAKYGVLPQEAERLYTAGTVV